MVGLRSGAFAGLLSSLAALGENPRAEDLPPGIAARLAARTLTFEKFHVYLTERFEGTEEGEAAAQQARRCRIVEAEGRARGVTVAGSAVQARRDEIERQLRAAGEGGLAPHLRAKGIPSGEFDGLLRLALLHEALVRADAGLAPEVPVAQDALERWLEERLAKAPAGGRPSPEELGRNLRHLLGPSRVKDLLLEAISTELVEERARALGIAPRPEDFDAQIERRRSRVAEDPKFMGASLDDLLRVTGRSVEALRRDPRTRTAVLLDLLVDRAFPPDQVARQFAGEKDRLTAEGEGRRTSLLLLRAAEKASGDVPLTFEQAEKELLALAPRCADAAAFAEAARARSDDEPSKAAGGDLGVLRRGDRDRDPALIEAAFRAEPGRLAGPVRLKEGAALLLVREKVPPPGEAALLERLRGELRSRLYREIVPPGPLATYLD